MKRRDFLRASAAVAASGALAAVRPKQNLVIILCDDLGDGDIHCYDSSIATPNIDRLAREGTRFTNAITANPVCSPSRAGLLTGRYPPRVGVPQVLFPHAKSGLDLGETTIAALLKPAGYATAAIGKWHLGDAPEYLPTHRGFDSYYGIPYSNDMIPAVVLENEKVVEAEANQDTLTGRYTERAVRFIEQHANQPFFLYLAHNFPHIPLHASSKFRNTSPLGIFGDVVSELDWSTGQVLDALARKKLDRNTLVLFTSDNGPWYQGSPGQGRGRKGSAWEGGVRVPFVARQPGWIPAGRVSKSLISHLDVFPTVCARTGVAAPRPPDGVDASALLAGSAAKLERNAILYFNGVHLHCVRRDDWKLHVARFDSDIYAVHGPGGAKSIRLQNPELYNMALDAGESYDVADRHPDIVRDLMARAEGLMHDFPAEIRRDWEETKAQSVRAIPSGAYPRLVQ